MVFCAFFFPQDVFEEIWDLIESVSEGSPTYVFNLQIPIEALGMICNHCIIVEYVLISNKGQK